LFRSLQDRLSPRHRLYAIEARRLDGDAIKTLEPMLHEAARAEGHTPSFENLPRDGSMVSRERIEPQTNHRQVEWFGRESFIKAMSRPAGACFALSTRSAAEFSGAKVSRNAGPIEEQAHGDPPRIWNWRLAVVGRAFAAAVLDARLARLWQGTYSRRSTYDCFRPGAGAGSGSWVAKRTAHRAQYRARRAPQLARHRSRRSQKGIGRPCLHCSSATLTPFIEASIAVQEATRAASERHDRREGRERSTAPGTVWARTLLQLRRLWRR
jgi:hypothetical protein